MQAKLRLLPADGKRAFICFDHQVNRDTACLSPRLAFVGTRTTKTIPMRECHRAQARSSCRDGSVKQMLRAQKY